MVRTGTVKFTVDSQLLGELGEKLVSKNYIALSELIKNAFDADASKIIIKFISPKNNTVDSQIHLIDNGQGMTFADVRDNWMTIATTDKVLNPISKKYGRRKTGYKGVGRFACRRLGMSLSLETIGLNEKTKNREWTKVEFIWDKFKPGTKLSEIECEYSTDIVKNRKLGTKLIIRNLNDQWTDYNFQILKRKILTLTVTEGESREGYRYDPGFDIIFDAPEFQEGKGELADMFMDAGWGNLNGRISDSGKLVLDLVGKAIGRKSYVIDEDFSLLEGIHFKIAIIFLDKKYYRNPEILTKHLASSIMQEQGGIRVYLDKFRIYPYGEKDNDWLGLERDKARSTGAVDAILKQLAFREKDKIKVKTSRILLTQPSNYNLIGKVFISSDNQNFDIKLDREGFVQNNAYDKLVRVLKLSLQWSTIIYRIAQKLIEEEELEKKEAEFEDQLTEDELLEPSSIIDKAIDVLKIEAKQSHPNLKREERIKSENRIESAANVIKQTINKTEVYLSILGAVASTNAYFFPFAHEIRNLNSRLATHALTINRLIDKIPVDSRNEFMNLEKSLLISRDRLDKVVDLYGLLQKKTKEYNKKTLLIKNEINEILSGFDYIIEYYEIIIETDISENLLTKPILEAEFYSIIVNLLSNAIKAVIAGYGNKILIKAEKIRNSIYLRMFNDGIKLNKKYWYEVFKPLVNDPENEIYKGLIQRTNDEEISLLGRGSGLGLSIIKDMIEKNNGSINFIDVDKPWKTGIEVIF